MHRKGKFAYRSLVSGFGYALRAKWRIMTRFSSLEKAIAKWTKQPANAQTSALEMKLIQLSDGNALAIKVNSGHITPHDKNTLPSVG